MLKRKCKITFISNGATVHTQDGLIFDTEKYPKLNELGEEEIDKVCEYLRSREVHYDTIYSSPSARCIQTAQIVAKLFKKKVTKIDLKSRQYGEWNGCTIFELFDEKGIDNFTKGSKNGESLKAFNERVAETINKLVEENKGNRIIVVTTQDVIQSAVAMTLEVTEPNQLKILIKTGTLTQISYFENNWSSLIYSDYMPL